MSSTQHNPTHCRLWRPWLGVFCLLALSIGGCRSADMKKEAQDYGFFSQIPAQGAYLTDDAGDVKIIQPGPHWMGRVAGDDGLTFANWRHLDGTPRFCIVVLCDPKGDRLVLLPLYPESTTGTTAHGSVTIFPIVWFTNCW